MKMYFYLQCKRLLKSVPGAICVVLVLMGGLLAAYSAMITQDANAEENQKFKIAISGSTEDPFLQMGMMALQAFDDTRFAIDIWQTTEEEAAQALQKGDIAAYVVIPEGFMDEAFRGNIMPLRFVSTTGAAGMVSVFKEELSQVFSSLLLEAQKGVYGMMNGFSEYGVPYQQPLVDKMCFTYVDYVLSRGDTYSYEELGIAEELGLEDYLLCGLAVLLLLLACLPFAPVMLRRDPALGRMLAAKGNSNFSQALGDLLSYLAGFLATVLAVGILIIALMGMPDIYQLMDILAGVLPVVLMVVSLSFLLYSLCGDLISGVLLQFFLTVALCFVSGCMYPVFFFPESIQRIAAWLPTGIARTWLSHGITGRGDQEALLGVLIYSVVFAVGGIAARVRAVGRSGR